MEDLKILFEDKQLIIVEKPIGVMSQLDSKGGDSMPQRLSEYLISKGEESYIGVVHRLDTTTGGVIAYSKNPKITGKMSELVRGDGYYKEYLCVLEGKLEDEKGILCDFLYHDKQKNKSYVVKGQRRGAKEARLEYSVIDSVENDKGVKSLVSVHLLTGRTHQIRVQFGSRKHPLCGDGKYGSRDNGCVCALWSHRCVFEHPVTHKKTELVSYPDDKYPWDMFKIK